MSGPVDLGDDPDGDMDEQEAIALAWSLHDHHYSERCEPTCPYRIKQRESEVDEDLMPYA